MLKSTTAFTQAYHHLNLEQKQAVDAIEGPVMVIAGPGTGKTQILATRIAHILLKTDTNPSSILALTFTESGASAMKKRLIRLIGQAAYGVRVQTFHSFCSDVISTHPEFFPLDIESQPLNDLERFQLFEDILEHNSFEYIKPINAPHFYLRSLLKNIQDLKREGVTPDQFEQILVQEAQLIDTESESWKKVERERRKKNYQKNSELLLVYRHYQQLLTEKHRYDFEDMIALTAQAFLKHELLLLEFQEKFQYFLIDEYQDTNSAQNQVISLLASYWDQEANIFVVGDPNQSIYRFQGASLENTFQFLKQYQQATVITLKQNYRSSQYILDAAQSLISHQTYSADTPIPLEQKLISQKKKGNPIQLIESASPITEAVYIAQTIQKLLENQVPAEEIAVLYRTNSESRLIADVLSRWGIQFDIEGGADVLHHPTVTQLLQLLNVIRDIRYSVEDVNFFTVLNYHWVHLDSLLILQLLRFAQEKKVALYSLLTSEVRLAEYREVQKPDLKELEKVTTFARKLAYWSGLDAQMAFPAWFETVISESGFFDSLLSQPNVVEQLNIINTLFTEIKRMTEENTMMHLELFLQTIQTMIDHSIALTEDDLHIKQHAVSLVTAHKSKGQEWSHVFVLGLTDKKWGNSISRNPLQLPEGILQFSKTNDQEKVDDERRLFYVALTRAKEQLYLSYPLSVQSSQGSRETTPSLYLEEISSTYIQKVTQVTTPIEVEHLLSKLIRSTPTPVVQSTQESHFIDEVLEKYKLSSTGLNTYLECPYKFKLQVLFKVPRAKPSYLAFGTAIHKVLEFLFGYMKDHAGEIPTLQAVLSELSIALKKELLSESDFAVRLEQGQHLIRQYYTQYEKEFLTPLFVERSFGRGFSQPMLNDIPLSGKMDKIELLNAQKKTVKVVDYKTGKPKSRNEIEGKTKNSTGNYKRQIIFYKLLADLDRSFQMTVEQTEFDFVQPKDDGTFVKHSFQITEAEIQDLKNTIIEVMTKIRKHEFPKTTDLTICETCIFKHHCYPEGIGALSHNISIS